MWDVRTKQLVHTFEAAHSDAVVSVAVTPDSNFIVSGSDDNTIKLLSANPFDTSHVFSRS